MTVIDTTNQDFAAAIVNGRYDEHLDEITALVRSRREALARLRSYDLKVGDRATIHGLSPKYLNGHTVEVVEAPTGKRTVSCKFVGQVPGRYGNSQVVKVPVVCLTPIG